MLKDTCRIAFVHQRITNHLLEHYFRTELGLLNFLACEPLHGIVRRDAVASRDEDPRHCSGRAIYYGRGQLAEEIMEGLPTVPALELPRSEL